MVRVEVMMFVMMRIVNFKATLQIYNWHKLYQSSSLLLTCSAECPAATCVCACAYVCTCVSVCVCVYVCVSVCVCVCVLT
jgi:hypothetical protein